VTELIVSLSGLFDDLRRTPEFASALDRRGVPLTHLLRPAAAPDELVDWIRERCGRGDAMALHGYDHALRPLGNARGRRGEFAELPRHEAGLRLTAARRALTALGLRTDVFVPPRWLASDGTVAALHEQGFRVLADDFGIRDLPSGAVEAARVLGFRAAGEH
jgi:predicted deacetylase